MISFTHLHERDSLMKRFVFPTSTVIAAMVLGLWQPSGASAHHMGDIALENLDGRIVTGHIHLDGDEEHFHASRVFQAWFGDEGTPNWTEAPGFDSGAGTWPSGGTMSFNILDALRQWDGTDFDTIPAERVSMHSSGNTATTPLVPEVVAGFSSAVTADGAWHKHYDFQLTSPASDGIYLLRLELLNSDPAVAPSEPFFLVFRQDENFTDDAGTRAQWEAAVAYAETTLVPEPGSIAILFSGLVSLGILARQRRKRTA